ncbi:MAG: hypothetical protein Q9211_002357 [Gyalolechia sp. 1 TL-2023]
MRASSFRSLLPLSLLALITRGITYNAQVEPQIRNKLSLYSLAVDNKQFDLLDQIFIKDIDANYSISTDCIQRILNRGQCPWLGLLLINHVGPFNAA